jgi:hypothetical protein
MDKFATPQISKRQPATRKISSNMDTTSSGTKNAFIHAPFAAELSISLRLRIITVCISA